MGNIEKKIDKNAQLTIYTAKVSLSGEEVRNAIRDFYEHGPITRNVLWGCIAGGIDRYKRERC